jgi:hypothetical protein
VQKGNGSYQAWAANDACWSALSQLFLINPGDVLQIAGYQTTGTNKALGSLAVIGSRVCIFRIPGS